MAAAPLPGPWLPPSPGRGKTPFLVFTGEAGLPCTGRCFHCSVLSPGAAAIPWGPGSEQGPWVQGWPARARAVAVTAVPVLSGGDGWEQPGGPAAPSVCSLIPGDSLWAPLALLPQ